MTLATRCSACGTSFRVVQDQLKVSGGWVRCGRCNEVFNAIEGLYEIGSPIAEPSQDSQIERDQAGADEALTPSSAPAPALATAEPGPPRWPALDEEWVTPEGDPAFTAAVTDTDTDTDTDADADTATTTAAEVSATDDQAVPTVGGHPVEGAADASAHGDREDPPLEAAPAIVATAAGPDLSEPAAATSDEPAPSFVRAAQRAERWRRPGVRRSLSAAAMVLLLLLAAQATMAYRDIVSARWPAWRAPLVQACSWLGCSVDPPRHIASLAVESSSLQQVGTTTIYNLSFAVRNRGETDVLLPALDLVLTDTQGKTLVRRVLTMSELGHAAPTLAPGAEVSLQAGLNTGDRRVAGYTIEVFYP